MSTTITSKFLLSVDKVCFNRNGVGKLMIYYNDGTLRISRDEDQKLTYIHVLEPLAPELLSSYPSYA